MAEYIFIFSMLVVFLWRDVQLLTTRGDWPVSRRLAAYAVLQFASLAGFRLLLSPVADGRFIHLLRLPIVWIVSIALHGAALLLCIAIRRAGVPRKAWLVALIPSPVLLLSLLSLASGTPAGEMRLSACLLATVLWMVPVSGAALEASRHTPDRELSSFAIEFAGLSNATMLAAIPVMLIPF
jgi:hypothetical protein